MSVNQPETLRHTPTLLPCPFCGSANIDPEGWVSTDRAGPACDDCAGTADTIDLWNTRPNEKRIEVGWRAGMRISRAKLEAAARAYLLEQGYEYAGKSIIACAESTDRDVYNPRAAKAVEAARKILKAGQP